MPWKVVESEVSGGTEYCVHKLNPDGSRGEQVACHKTRDDALAQVRALYANEPGATKIAKVDEDEQLVFGWAYVSTGENGDLIVDSDGESIEPHELEKAAYDYVLEAREAGEMHEGEPLGKMVESLVVTPEKAKAMGLPPTDVTAWWIGLHIENADAFAKVKDGTYAMFSVQGFGHVDEGAE